ncbi:MAG: CotH kinase family protein [Acutalibacteraceae bacterium]
MKKKVLVLITAFLAFCCLSSCNQSVIDSEIYISEVMADNISVFADENGDMCDWIELHNPTEEKIDLEGYILTDGSDKFTFPSFIIEADEYLVVFADAMEKTDSASRAVHVPFSLSSSSGERVLLYNSKGRLVNAISLSDLGKDQSIGIDENNKIKVFSSPTPGKPNYQADTEEESVKAVVGEIADSGNLLINEYSTSSNCTVTDDDGDFVSFAEIYYGGENSLNLGSYYLSDDENDKQKWKFPDIEIKSGEYLVVYLSGKTKTYTKGGDVHCDFKLKGDEDCLCIFDSAGNTVDRCKVYDLVSNLTCGRPAKDNSRFAFFAKATPGKANTLKAFDSVESARMTGNKAVAITEVAAVNTTVPQSSLNEYFDYVELINNTNKTVNLKNYKLSDSKKSESFKTLPDRNLEPGEYIAVFCGDSDRVSPTTGNIYVSFGLNRKGETVYLLDKNNVVVDTLEYSRLSSGYSAGRDVNQTDEVVYFNTLTPGKANPKTKLSSALPNPELSQESTYLKKGSEISISVCKGEIHYTLDGSEPDENSPVYSKPITVNKNTVIRAKAFSDGSVPSDTVTATYLVGKKHSLPVVFITTDNKNLYDYNTGIWADGPGKSSEFPYVGANYWQDWERPVNFEFMTEDGVSQVNFDAGIKVFGQFSRALPQKSVSINLRDKYGPTEVCYPFFDDSDVNVFSSLILRNSGQDFSKSHIRDAFCASVIKGSVDVDFMDYQPVVAYVNGKYHGIYDLREKIDEDYLANHQGIDPENVDIIKGNSIVQKGTIDSYDALLNYIKTHDMKDEKCYKYVCSQIDIDELISYWMCESFFTNTDTGNIRFYKENTENGKWRWVFFDVDWALYPSTYELNYIENYLDPKGHGVGDSFRTTIMVGLIKNPDFRKRLLEIHSEHLKTTFDTDRMLKIYDELIKEIEPEMENHCKRWPEGVSYESWQRNVKELRSIIEQKKAIFIDDMIETFNMTDEEIQKYLK